MCLSRIFFALRLAFALALGLAGTARAEGPAISAPPEPEKVTIRARKDRAPAGSTAIVLDEKARATPGAMGDALVTVQSTPSVARPPAGSSQVVVWGSAPSETRVYVDDVPIPYLYHRGGLRAVINADLVSSIEVTPAGFSAGYGRAIGGLLRLRTSPVPKEGLGGYVALDPLDASFALRYRQTEQEGPWTVALGGRYGWLDRLLPLVAADAGTFPLPSYADLATKFIYRDSDGITELAGYGALDSLVKRVPESRGARESAEDIAFSRVSLRRTWRSGTALVWAGRDTDRTTLQFGPERTSQRLLALRGGLRISRSILVANAFTARVGADVEVALFETRRTGTLSLPAREGDLVVFGQPPARRLAADTWNTTNVGAAPYLELEWRVSPKLTVTPALRLETLVLEGSQLLPTQAGSVDVGYSRFELYPDPRMRAEYTFSQALSMQLSGGIYHQAPDPLDTSATFGGTSLGPARGLHFVAGTTWRPTNTFGLEWSIFAKELSGLTVRSRQEAPVVAANLVDSGRGRSVGAQVVARVPQWGMLSGWVSYGISRAERSDGATWRRFDFDQPHLLTAVASVEPAKGWRFGARLRVASGYPKTQVVGATYESRLGEFQPIRAGQARLPMFAQLDLHAEHSRLINHVKCTFYLDAINVTNRTNAEEIVYSFDYRNRDYLTSFPFLALVGARIEK
jgi:TonB dependent receptor/TonB-dependent Receptor Plug Domain